MNRNASRTLVPNDRPDFAPRLGFAYNVLPKTVIRGGYGHLLFLLGGGSVEQSEHGVESPFYYNASSRRNSLIEPNPIVSKLSNGFPEDALSNPNAAELLRSRPEFPQPVCPELEFQRTAVVGVEYGASTSPMQVPREPHYDEFRNAN